MPPQLTPTADAYAVGFARIAPLADSHRALLKSHHAALNRTRTATQLSEAVGYENFNAVNLQYGLLAARLGEAMGFKDANLSLIVEFTEPHTHNNEHWTLEMRAEVAEALERLGWV